MADEVLDTLPQTPDVHYRQASAPTNVYGTTSAQNTDNHDLKVAGRGKGRMTVFVDNQPNAEVTISVYGSQTADGDVGDDDVVQIGSSFAVAADTRGYETVNDPFPYYIIRANYAAAPTDSPAVALTIYCNFSAF